MKMLTVGQMISWPVYSVLPYIFHVCEYTRCIVVDDIVTVPPVRHTSYGCTVLPHCSSYKKVMLSQVSKTSEEFKHV